MSFPREDDCRSLKQSLQSLLEENKSLKGAVDRERQVRFPPVFFFFSFLSPCANVSLTCLAFLPGWGRCTRRTERWSSMWFVSFETVCWT